MRVRFLRTACPACWLLDVSRLIASRMVFRAQGESPAPRSWERRATCSRRVVRRVCSELIMWYRKLTILDRISKRHSRPLDFPLGASRLPTRKSATSHSEGCDFRVGASQIPLGNPTKSGLTLLQHGSDCLRGRTGPAAPSWGFARLLLDRSAHLQLLSVST